MLPFLIGCVFLENLRHFSGRTPFILLSLRVSGCLMLPSELHDMLLQGQEALSYSGVSESESQGVARLRLDFEKPPALAGQQSG